MTDPYPDDFPGTLYDGDGMRLAGMGPDFTPALSGTLPFKVVVRHRRAANETGELGLGDRLWLLPDTFGTTPELPVALLAELAEAVRRGHKVGLAGRDRGADVLARRAGPAAELGRGHGMSEGAAERVPPVVARAPRQPRARGAACPDAGSSGGRRRTWTRARWRRRPSRP